MGMSRTRWAKAGDFLSQVQPDAPTLLFAPHILARAATTFKRGFPGRVSYAIKANPDREVLETLMAHGIDAFDVASPVECKQVRDLMPNAVLSYNNPVRSTGQIRAALDLGVRSFSVDRLSELEKLSAIAHGLPLELSVRIHLPVKGAAYDFGTKFGASPDNAVRLLGRVVARGFTPSMTFHPGTQCTDPNAWQTYIVTCGEIARSAGVALARLNVGGGFPTADGDARPQLDRIFATIQRAWKSAFSRTRCTLICEPGRALVAEAYSLVTRVRAIGPKGEVFLNDGIYGGLAELPQLHLPRAITCYRATGTRLDGPHSGHIVFGPTCDSLDVLPGIQALPNTLCEGDFVVFHGMGAYSAALATRFNGYGAHRKLTLREMTTCS